MFVRKKTSIYKGFGFYADGKNHCTADVVMQMHKTNRKSEKWISFEGIYNFSIHTAKKK